MRIILVDTTVLILSFCILTSYLRKKHPYIHQFILETKDLRISERENKIVTTDLMHVLILGHSGKQLLYSVTGEAKELFHISHHTANTGPDEREWERVCCMVHIWHFIQWAINNRDNKTAGFTVSESMGWYRKSGACWNMGFFCANSCWWNSCSTYRYVCFRGKERVHIVVWWGKNYLIFQQQKRNSKHFTVEWANKLK